MEPFDLHHLLERSQYPDLMYEFANVIPLCTMVHTAITRKSFIQEIQNSYKQAQRDWLKISQVQKAGVFDEIMHRMHEEIYGSRS